MIMDINAIPIITYLLFTCSFAFGSNSLNERGILASRIIIHNEVSIIKDKSHMKQEQDRYYYF